MNIQPNAWRSRHLIPLFLGAIALVAVIVLLGQAFGENTIRQAQPAPSFVVKGPQGRTIKLADFKNKALIVCFLATWDEHSRKQMGILNDMVGQYGETNLAVLALALDQTGPDSLKTYAEQQHLRYALHAADYDVIQTFGGLTSVPVTFVIDKNQNVIDKLVGVTETNALDADIRAILKQ
jgi:peroxiredoxin